MRRVADLNEVSHSRVTSARSGVAGQRLPLATPAPASASECGVTAEKSPYEGSLDVPAANAPYTVGAFMASRFRFVQSRRHISFLQERSGGRQVLELGGIGSPASKQVALDSPVDALGPEVGAQDAEAVLMCVPRLFSPLVVDEGRGHIRE